MTTSKLEIAESNLRALKELKDSRGWSLLMELAKNDILDACLQMADNPMMTEKEIDFRSGAISSSRNFISVPDYLIARTESELLLASVEKQALSNLNAKA
jgi:hypothetical protein